MKYLQLILFFNLYSGFSQDLSYNLLAEYRVTWQPDSTNVKSKITTEKFILYGGNKKSLFISSNRLALDTIIYSGVNVADLQKLMSMSKPSSNKRIFKNFDNNSITVYDEISSSLFKFNEKINLDWKVYSDTVMVKKIVLRKATTSFGGRDYVAWFNEELPYSDGPYKFSGLPGLIFKIYDSKIHFEYELISYKILDKKYELKNNYDSNSKLTTKKEFNRSKKEFRVNPIPLMESEGAVFSEETKRIIKQKFRERVEQNNNPIELKEDNE